MIVRGSMRKSGNGLSRLSWDPRKRRTAYLKGLETLNTPALLGEDCRDGENLFDPDASVQLRADEWDRIWQRDRAELPRLNRALPSLSCRSRKC